MTGPRARLLSAAAARFAGNSGSACSPSNARLAAQGEPLALAVTCLRRSDVPALLRAARGLLQPPAPSLDGDTVLLTGSRGALAALAAALDPPQAALLRRALAGSAGVDPPTTACGGRTFTWGKRTLVMGIINMTPDSFSGDGLDGNADAALALGRRLVAEGADLLDVGGESSRPPHTYGAREPIGAAEELRRVLPAVRRLASELDLPISIDTTRPEVAHAALDAGAALINDVWGVAAHPEMLALAAARRVPIVLMHNQTHTRYHDLMDEIVGGLERAMDRALAYGVEPWQVIVDPGFGFGKTPAHNLELTARLGELRALGRPILYGSSRKSTLGQVLGLPPDQRVEGTAATVALAIANGADIVRVHDVAPLARVVRMTDAVVRDTWRRSS